MAAEPVTQNSLTDLANGNMFDQILRLQNNIVSWFLANWLDLLIIIAIGMAIFAGLSFLKRRAQALVARHQHLQGYSAVLLRAIGKTSRFFRIMVSAELVAGYADLPRVAASTIAFLFTISVVVQVAIWARAIMLGLIELRIDRDQERGEALENAKGLIRLLISVAVFAIAAIVILDNLGVNVAGLIAGLGIGGIAIGLAAQGIFSDLFSALSIIFDKPFRKGETIMFDTTTATVEKIGLKSTRLRSVTGQEVIVGNTQLLAKQIDNITRLSRRRVRLTIGIDYHTDPDKARQIPDLLRGIVESRGLQFVRGCFVAFGPSSLDFQLDFDVMSDDLEEMYTARHNVGLSIVEVFRAAGIAFAYPSQTTYTAAPDGSLIMPYAPYPAPLPSGGQDLRKS